LPVETCTVHVVSAPLRVRVIAENSIDALFRHIAVLPLHIVLQIQCL